MKVARLGAPGGEIPAVSGDDGWYDLRPLTCDIDGDFLSGDGPVCARKELHYGRLARINDADARRVGPPVARPGKIICIGDLINTGTPAGVALGLPGQPYLRVGDVVEPAIDGLGSARQQVAAA
jgi:2-keto-4-pentenoate hydratase/2-oxohepta-3-ene-1,7-dioic acid hydratase in catechol pathway